MEKGLKMQSIKLQFPVWEMEIIRELAEEKGISISSVFRKLIAGKLTKYLGSIRYKDPEDAKEIKKMIGAIYDETERLRIQFIRIGNNLNQAVWQGYNSDEFKSVESIEKVRDLLYDKLDEYDEHTKEMRDALCRIQ